MHVSFEAPIFQFPMKLPTDLLSVIIPTKYVISKSTCMTATPIYLSSCDLLVFAISSVATHCAQDRWTKLPLNLFEPTKWNSNISHRATPVNV